MTPRGPELDAEVGSLLNEPPAKDAATEAFDAIAKLCGCPEWDYPGQLVRDVERLARERDEARADVIAAAGDLLVPIPEPGSVVARLLSANAILRRERDEARAARKQAEERRDRWRTIAETPRDVWRERAEAAESRAKSHEDELHHLKRRLADVAQVLGSRALSTDRPINVAVLEGLAEAAVRRTVTAGATVARLRAALEWFADEGHYTGTYRQGAGYVDAVGLTRAREALSEAAT